jgi:exo-beta-1,3-glucanase (GH17 family)
MHPRADVTEYVTVTAPEVVVWVDEAGSTVSIETRTTNVAISTPSPISNPTVSDTPAVATPPSQSAAPALPSSLPSSYFAPPAPAPTEAPTTTLPPPAPFESAPISTPLPTASNSDVTPADFRYGPPSAPPASEPSASPAPEPSSTQAAALQAQGSGFGITWSPYNADSTCKSQDQANSEFAPLAGYGYTMVRTYGVDCNQVAMAIASAAKYNMVIFAGLTSLDNLVPNLNSMISQVGSNWHMINTVSIGNELVNDGLAAVEEVVAALGTTRSVLKPAGFGGPIVTVDVFDQIVAHPELCGASDYCAANCHAFFDDEITADKAGDYVSKIWSWIAQQIPGKEVMITESGWPWGGSANGAAIPSVANQQVAIASLRSAFANNSGSIFLFDSYDAEWKQSGPLGVEQYFGIYGH